MIGRIAYICANDEGNIIIGRLIENGHQVDIFKAKSDIKYIKNIKAIKVVVIHITSDKAYELDIANYMKLSFGLDNIKIVVVSKFTLREVIMRAVNIGAVEVLTDYTDSELIADKISKVSGIKGAKDFEDIYVEKDFILLSFRELVIREIKAANRGDYELSVMSLYMTDDVGLLYRDYSEDFLGSLKAVIKKSLRDTDYVFIHENHIVAILPFTNASGCQVVVNKLKDVYKSHPALKPVNTYTVPSATFATFPDDGRVADIIIDKAESDVKMLQVI